MKSVDLNSFKILLDAIKALRDPKTGCPWDLQQTQESLIPYLVEEAYELSEAILEKDQKKICDELGDYLFQVLIQCQISSEQGYFTIVDVVNNLYNKIVRRHPHVFSGEKVSGIEDVKRRWHEIKALEKAESQSSEIQSIFKKARSVNPLRAAQFIGDVTNKIKFDWENWSEVLKKVHEESNELFSELRAPSLDLKAIEHELGDLIFTLVQLARHLGLDSEVALNKANLRFKQRFELMVKLSGLSFQDFNKLPIEQKEMWYQKAKLESEIS